LERVVPADALEPAFAPLPDPPLRVEQAIGGVDDLGGAGAARADDPERMAFQRLQTSDPAALELELHTAAARADAAQTEYVLRGPALRTRRGRRPTTRNAHEQEPRVKTSLCKALRLSLKPGYGRSRISPGTIVAPAR